MNSTAAEKPPGCVGEVFQPQKSGFLKISSRNPGFYSLVTQYSIAEPQ
jgi:hypothetical protein